MSHFYLLIVKLLNFLSLELEKRSNDLQMNKNLLLDFEIPVKGYIKSKNLFFECFDMFFIQGIDVTL